MKIHIVLTLIKYAINILVLAYLYSETLCVFIYVALQTDKVWHTKGKKNSHGIFSYTNLLQFPTYKKQRRKQKTMTSPMSSLTIVKSLSIEELQNSIYYIQKQPLELALFLPSSLHCYASHSK